MWNYLLDYWNYNNTFTAVDFVDYGDQQSLYLAKGKKYKGEIENISFQKYSNITEVASKCDHLQLNISGKKVLVQRASKGADEGDILSNAFPNINIEDFYYQIVAIENQNLVFISRKSYIDTIIKEFKDNDIYVIGVSLGFSVITNLLPLLKNQEIQLSAYYLRLKPELFFEIKKYPEKKVYDSYQIDTIKVQPEFLIALATIFLYFNPIPQLKDNIGILDNSLKKAFFSRNFFKKFLRSSIAFLLLILLINFILFSSFYKSLQQEQQDFNALKKQQQLTEKEQSKLNSKEKLVDNILNNSNSTSLYYINKIVGHLPHSLKLKELNFQPITRKIKEGQEIEFTSNVIQIHGTSEEKKEFSEWIGSLENQQWIHSVNVSEYSYLSNTSSEFALLIEIDNED